MRNLYSTLVCQQKPRSWAGLLCPLWACFTYTLCKPTSTYRHTGSSALCQPHIAVVNTVYENEMRCHSLAFPRFFRASKWNAVFYSTVSTSIFCVLNDLLAHVSLHHVEDAYEMSCFYYYSCSTCHWTLKQIPQCNDTDILILSCFKLATSQKETVEYFSKTPYAAITFMFPVLGEIICYRNWWPTWYFKRLRCILLSDCFPQIYICLKGGCGCQR